MSLFKAIKNTEMSKLQSATPSYNNQYGVNIKQILLNYKTNQIFILGPKNIIFPLSQKTQLISKSKKLKQYLDLISSNLNNYLFKFFGKNEKIQNVDVIKDVYKNVFPGVVVSILNNVTYVHIGNGQWVQLGIQYDQSSFSFIPSLINPKFYSEYVIISDVKLLAKLCKNKMTKKPTNLDVLSKLSSQSKSNVKNFNQLFWSCIHSGLSVSEAIDMINNNPQKIKLETPNKPKEQDKKLKKDNVKFKISKLSITI